MAKTVEITVQGVINDEKNGRWIIDVEEKKDDGTTEPLRVVRPFDTVMHRCAEYGIEEQDQDTLVEILLFEMYIPREHWMGADYLFSASTIQKAREAYLRELKKLKKSILIRDPQGHLNTVRQSFQVSPAALAIRSLNVVLERHRNGAQKLDPDVARALSNFERAADPRKNGE